MSLHLIDARQFHHNVLNKDNHSKQECVTWWLKSRDVKSERSEYIIHGGSEVNDILSHYQQGENEADWVFAKVEGIFGK